MFLPWFVVAQLLLRQFAHTQIDTEWAARLSAHVWPEASEMSTLSFLAGDQYPGSPVLVLGLRDMSKTTIWHGS